MLPRLKALSLLFGALLRTLLRLLLGRGRRGIAAFRSNYDADGLPPVSAEERAVFEGFGRCIACARCDRGEGARIVASQGRYRGVMAFVVAGSRSMPDHDAAAAMIEGVPDAVFTEQERHCPTGVPILALVRFVRAKAAQGPGQAPAALPPARGSVPAGSVVERAA